MFHHEATIIPNSRKRKKKINKDAQNFASQLTRILANIMQDHLD